LSFRLHFKDFPLSQLLFPSSTDVLIEFVLSLDWNFEWERTRTADPINLIPKQLIKKLKIFSKPTQISLFRLEFPMEFIRFLIQITTSNYWIVKLQIYVFRCSRFCKTTQEPFADSWCESEILDRIRLLLTRLLTALVVNLNRWSAVWLLLR
jgi:hypothetical protein